MEHGVKQGEYQHRFTCYLCGETFYSRPEDDESCRQEFIERYGHTPEETTDDDLVSLCDSCNEEYEKRAAEWNTT